MAAKVTQFDLDNFNEIIAGGADHFSAHLYRLIKKADYENRLKLMSVFPRHVEVLELWECSNGRSRLWVCHRGHINCRPSDESHPSRCMTCLCQNPADAPPEEPPLPTETERKD